METLVTASKLSKGQVVIVHEFISAAHQKIESYLFLHKSVTIWIDIDIDIYIYLKIQNYF